MPAAVASSSSHPSAGAADRGVSAPSGLTVGDLCLVIANTDGAGGDLDLSGAGTWTKLAAAPAAVPGVHVFAATDVAAADGPWTLTGASGEWVHRMSVRITDPGDVSVGGHFNGTPGSTPPNWDAAIIPTTDAPADDTLSIIAAYVMGTNDSVPSTTLIANPSGALAARWRLVDEGPTGTTSWSPANVWAVVTAVRILVAPADDGPTVIDGTGDLTASAALGGGGLVVADGTGSLAASATLTGDGVVIGEVEGTGTLGATATVAGVGLVTAHGTGGLTATAGLDGIGVVVGQVEGTGTLAATVTATGDGEPVVEVVVVDGTGALAATVTASGVGLSVTDGTGSLTGTAALAGDGQVIQVATVVDGTGALTAAATLAGAGSIPAPIVGRTAPTGVLVETGARQARVAPSANTVAPAATIGGRAVIDQGAA